MKKLTSKQADILNHIKPEPRSVDSIAANAYQSLDAIYASLRRMEDRGFVRRIYRGPESVEAFPVLWELTNLGKSALYDYELV